MVVFTGNKAFLVPTIWESALGAKAGKIAPFPQHNHRPRVMMLKDISDIRILKYKLGIFVYVAKHIDDFHDDDKVITVLKYCHRLLRDGLDLEVTWLLGYMISTKGNGIDRRRLTTAEEREFANISKENRIMQRYALVTDIAEDKGRAEGKAEGKAEVALRMLEEGIRIEVISRITGLKRSELNKLKRT